MGYGVTVTDVESRWRDLSSEERAVAQVLIEDLESDLDLHRPLLSDKISALYALGDEESSKMASALERTIRRVIAGAIKRTLRNVEAYRFTNLTADGGIHVGFDNSTEGLTNTEARLAPGDFADIDSAVSAVDGVTSESVGSVRLVASRGRISVPNINTLPLP